MKVYFGSWTFLVAVAFSCLIASQLTAQQLPTDPPIVIDLDDIDLPPPVELGDISSDGTTGRQFHIRPRLESEIGRDWVYFPPHSQLPDQFPEPTPNSPPQDSIRLLEGTSLVAVIPQLQHKPTAGFVSASHQLIGNTVTIDAMLQTFSGATATIYGPHEYLLPLGDLDAGEYHVDVNLTRIDDRGSVSTHSGFMKFQVFAVPEPAGSASMLIGILVFVLSVRSRHR